MELKNIARDRALAMLRAAGCEYVVVDPEGQQHSHGSLEVAPPKKRTRIVSKDRPFGELVRYYRPFLEPMQPGDSTMIPYGKYEIEKKTLHASVSAWCSKHWGNKKSLTHANDAGVEVLRIE